MTNEQLLEKARKDYPIGTKFKPVHTKDGDMLKLVNKTDLNSVECKFLQVRVLLSPPINDMSTGSLEEQMLK